MPSPQPIVRWFVIANIFDPFARTLILVVNFATPLIVYLFSKLNVNSEIPEYKRFRSLSGIFLTSFCMNTGNTMRFIPRTKFFRIFTFLWAIYSLHIYSIASTQLISLMTKTPYEPRMSNYDVINGKIPITLTNATKSYFSLGGHLINGDALKVQKKFVECLKIRTCLAQAALQR